MDRLAEVSTEELRSRIQERKELVRKFSNFIISVMNKHGTLVERRVESWHTYTRRELHGFGPFDFIYADGLSMMGGSWTEAYFESKKVFSVHLSGQNIYRIYVFDPSSEWRAAMNDVMAQKDEIIAQSKKGKEDRKLQQILETGRKQEREQLLQEAKELKL